MKHLLVLATALALAGCQVSNFTPYPTPSAPAPVPVAPQQVAPAELNGIARFYGEPMQGTTVKAYLMGKAALAGGSAHDLNNLAAFLSMQHAETAALPILYTLNARYPNNSTLLNNLGQALYGLGDTEEAEKFLIAAVSIAPLHPQANATQARIQEARGDHQAAQASLHKALQGGFSNAKEEQLRKAGGKLNADDVRWRRPMPQDPLGLEKFVIPAYPMKSQELPVATAQWQAFHRAAGELTNKLGQQQQRISAGLNANGALSAAMSAVRSPYILRASTLMGDITEQYEITFKKQTTALTEAMLDFPEEDVDPLHVADARSRLERLRSALEDLLGAEVAGVRREDGENRPPLRRHAQPVLPEALGER